ncbi:DUF308 domain-containing protein [Streptomyces sp. NPDC059909]|uniref:DUF308 domain-containing protein n=1 Tax=Streptomyces sp. NPDC059909 TaxID=3346998 RepID=UPI0036632DCB
MSTNTQSSRTPLADNPRSSLLKLYLGRGILAVAWAAAFSVNHDPLDAPAIILLAVYPLIDAVSSLIDYRAVTNESQRRVTLFNGVLSTLIAITLGVAGANGAQAVLHVFGAWAVISGVAQIVVGIRRRSPELGTQWPMLLAGGLSILAGIGHNTQALADQPKLGILVLYTTAGGVFFIIQAGLLARRARLARTQIA